MLLYILKEPEKIELEESYIENKPSILKMFDIQEKVINSNNNNIQIDATKCKYISSTCLAILSSIALVSKDKNIRISFTKKSRLLHTLSNNRIYKYRLWTHWCKRLYSFK